MDKLWTFLNTLGLCILFLFEWMPATMFLRYCKPFRITVLLPKIDNFIISSKLSIFLFLLFGTIFIGGILSYKLKFVDTTIT